MPIVIGAGVLGAALIIALVGEPGEKKSDPAEGIREAEDRVASPLLVGYAAAAFNRPAAETASTGK